jgi:uncharacterized membrane protein (Fun14 family)
MTETKDIVEQAIEKAKPILLNIGFGSIMGYCSGVAMQKVGKAFAVIIGTTFVGLQVAVSLGYIDVKWDKVADGVHAKIDLTDDGKIDAKDAKEYWKKLKTILTHKLPSAGGFSFGFLYGVRHG